MYLSNTLHCRLNFLFEVSTRSTSIVILALYMHTHIQARRQVQWWPTVRMSDVERQVQYVMRVARQQQRLYANII